MISLLLGTSYVYSPETSARTYCLQQFSDLGVGRMSEISFNPVGNHIVKEIVLTVACTAVCEIECKVNLILEFAVHKAFVESGTVSGIFGS